MTHVNVQRRLTVVVTALVLACLLLACGAASVLPPTATREAVATRPALPSSAPTPLPTPTALPQSSSTPAATRSSAPALSGAVWRLQRFEYMSGKVVNVAQPDLYTVQFQNNGKLLVKADCNTGAGTYQVDGDRLTIENVAMTKMACRAESLFDQFVASINNAVSYALDGEELTISMMYDGGEIVFAKER